MTEIFEKVLQEAQIGGVQKYASGEMSGRALAGDLANKGIRDITQGTNGRGQAEVDKTGVYVGVPMGSDKTAWANPSAAKQMVPGISGRVDLFQKVYNKASPKQRANMQDWTPDQPDMKTTTSGQVVDTNTNTVMKESVFETILENNN